MGKLAAQTVLIRRSHSLISLFGIIGISALASITSAAKAQDEQSNYLAGYSPDPSPFQSRVSVGADTIENPTATVATSTAGAVGQRLESGKILGNVKPMARLETRISNRVQSRMRNRIDRNYDSEANAASPFAIAAERTHDNTITAPSP